MKKLFQILILVVFFPLLGNYAQSQTDYNLSNLISFDGEPYIAVNPNNPKNIIAAWMRLRINGKISIAVKNTFDGGDTWSYIQFLPHIDAQYGSADVSIAFYRSGIAYLSYIDIDWTDTTATIFVTKSTDGGNKWANPVPVFYSTDLPDKPIDRPWIAVDNSGTLTDGYVYVTSMTLNSKPFPHHVYIKYSSNKGKSWSKIRQVDNDLNPVGNIPISYGALDVDGAGKLYVAYFSYDTSINPFLRLLVANTDKIDNGFNYSVASNVFMTPGWLNYNNAYSLSANHNDTSSVIVAWTDNRFGDNDIVLSQSINRGTNWNIPIRLNNDAKANGVFQDKIWTNYSLSGTLSIIWRDRRNGGAGDSVPADIYCVISKDNGVTFSNNIKLSKESAPYKPIPCCNSFISIASVDSTVFGIWGDDRTNDWEIYFSKCIINVSTAVNNYRSYSCHISIYPNPFSESTNIRFEIINPSFVSLTIYDMLGNEISRLVDEYKLSGIYNIQFDSKKIKSGLYYYILKIGSKTVIGKLVCVK